MYQTLNDILTGARIDLTAAEAHGLATGMLIVDNGMEANRWLDTLAAETAPEASTAILLAWFDDIRTQVIDPEDEFAYDLCLPDTDQPVSEQAEALRSWCEGFLFGIGQDPTTTDWPEDTAEIMRDLVELTKIDSNIADETDSDALMEIHEYLRAAVFIVREHFSAPGPESNH